MLIEATNPNKKAYQLQDRGGNDVLELNDDSTNSVVEYNSNAAEEQNQNTNVNVVTNELQTNTTLNGHATQEIRCHANDSLKVTSPPLKFDIDGNKRNSSTSTSHIEVSKPYKPKSKFIYRYPTNNNNNNNNTNNNNNSIVNEDYGQTNGSENCNGNNNIETNGHDLNDNKVNKVNVDNINQYPSTSSQSLTTNTKRKRSKSVENISEKNINGSIDIGIQKIIKLAKTNKDKVGSKAADESENLLITLDNSTQDSDITILDYSLSTTEPFECDKNTSNSEFCECEISPTKLDKDCINSFQVREYTILPLSLLNYRKNSTPKDLCKKKTNLQTRRKTLPPLPDIIPIEKYSANLKQKQQEANNLLNSKSHRDEDCIVFTYQKESESFHYNNDKNLKYSQNNRKNYNNNNKNKKEEEFEKTEYFRKQNIQNFAKNQSSTPQMGMNIFTKLHRLFSSNKSEEQSSRKRRSEVLPTNENSGPIKQQKLDHGHIKIATAKKQNNNKKMSEHNKYGTGKTIKTRKSLFAKPKTVHHFMRASPYADIEFSSDEEADVSESKAYSIPTARADEEPSIIYTSINTMRPNISQSTAHATSISATAPKPLTTSRYTNIYNTERDCPPQKPLYSSFFKPKIFASSAQSSVSTSCAPTTSLSGIHAYNNNNRSRAWPQPTNSILTHQNEQKERDDYQHLLLRMMPTTSNENDAISCRKPLISSIDLTSTTSKSFIETSGIVKKKQITKIEIESSDESDVILVDQNVKKNLFTPIAIVDSDDDIGASESALINYASKSKIDVVNKVDKKKTPETLPYVQPVNSFKTRLTSPHIGESWLQNFEEKWNQRRKIVFHELEQVDREAKELTEKREARVEESLAGLRNLEIVDYDLIVVDDTSLPDSIAEDDEVQEVFAELTPDIRRKITTYLTGSLDQILVSKFNLNITRRDIQTLMPNNWLNDEVINFYMNLLNERGDLKHESHGLPRVYAMNTFFMLRLLQAGHAGVRRWTRKVDIFSKDILPIPVHVGGVHWCMAIIHFKNKSIKYYDSMGQPNPKVLEALLQYIKDESLDKLKRPYDTNGFVIESVKNVPRQMNGSDCGVFSCMFAEYISRNKSVTFSQENMDYFRHKMIYEIVSGTLLQ